MDMVGDISSDLQRAYNEGRSVAIRWTTCNLLANGKTVRLEEFVASIRNEIGTRKTIVFTQDMTSADLTANELNAFGVYSASIGWRTSFVEGARIVQEFKEGPLQCIVGGKTMVTIGMDLPETSCIVLLRKTKSRAELLHMIGKGCRPAPGKQDCLVVDFTSAL